jgi:hypothetical protein
MRRDGIVVRLPTQTETGVLYIVETGVQTHEWCHGPVPSEVPTKDGKSIQIPPKSPQLHDTSPRMESFTIQFHSLDHWETGTERDVSPVIWIYDILYVFHHLQDKTCRFNNTLHLLFHHLKDKTTPIKKWTWVKKCWEDEIMGLRREDTENKGKEWGPQIVVVISNKTGLNLLIRTTNWNSVVRPIEENVSTSEFKFTFTLKNWNNNCYNKCKSKCKFRRRHVFYNCLYLYAILGQHFSRRDRKHESVRVLFLL